MSTATAAGFRVIDRNELKAKLDSNEKFQLWNVLRNEYFNAEKNIPGSKWVPVDQLGKQLSSLNVNKNDDIVVYCASTTCTSSKQAAQFLSQEGFTKVSAYEGGLADWAEGGLPFEKLS